MSGGADGGGIVDGASVPGPQHPPAPTLWTDADATPGVVKEILFRAARRTSTRLVLVANQPLHVPPSPHIRMVQVARGFDVADHHILSVMQAGDLVITADIPLAAEAVGRGGYALNPRGEFYTRHNVGELLDLRNFMETMRGMGMATGGPAPYGPREQQAFANRLDRFLAGHRR